MFEFGHEKEENMEKKGVIFLMYLRPEEVGQGGGLYYFFYIFDMLDISISCILKKVRYYRTTFCMYLFSS